MTRHCLIKLTKIGSDFGLAKEKNNRYGVRELRQEWTLEREIEREGDHKQKRESKRKQERQKQTGKEATEAEKKEKKENEEQVKKETKRREYVIWK